MISVLSDTQVQHKLFAMLCDNWDAQLNLNNVDYHCLHPWKTFGSLLILFFNLTFSQNWIEIINFTAIANSEIVSHPHLQSSNCFTHGSSMIKLWPNKFPPFLPKLANVIWIWCEFIELTAFWNLFEHSSNSN